MLLIAVVFFLGTTAIAAQQRQKRFTVMGIGDSITEGGASFSSYLYPLWEKLFSSGYDFDFIGPRQSECRIGKLNHCGFSGKNAEFIASQVDSVYRIYPADFVLIHAGHNHFVEEKPVKGIIAAYRKMIATILAVNPDAHILMAQVVSSGKLPKYSYITQLNKEIEKMVKSYHSSQIVLVNQNKGFDWETMTIADKVHPNSKGREQMANTWFAALRRWLQQPPYHFAIERIPYKVLPSGDSLYAHVFRPEQNKMHSAVGWFFAGGWKYGSPLQFYRESACLAELGVLSVTFDYRISYLYHTTDKEALEDAKDAVRWMRTHADELGISASRIAVGGASAGASMAALLGSMDREGSDSLAIPNLLLLEYPTLALPKAAVREKMPPMLLCMGTNDEFTPMYVVDDYINKVRTQGNECEFHPFEGRHHPIFYYRKPLTKDYYTLLSLIEAFLRRHGYLSM